AQRGVSVEYIGADLSNGALDLARQSGVTTALMLGDATETTAQLLAGSQDVVIAKNLLHHLDDPTAFLTEAARAVGPGGKVVVIEPLLGCPHIWVFNVLAFRRERHYFRGQKRNLSAFREAGLAVENGQRFSWLPWELMLYIRPSVFRRLLSTTNERTIGRIGRFDDWLTSRIPWTAAYVVWTVTPENVHDGEPRPAPSTTAR
ncbi:MAG: class I SAM-dependent methyltransferase, partial [Actinobacteria bacterium]|nr:class I SAM-dependent methyltransferase [Actinomycetota bacterium]